MLLLGVFQQLLRQLDDLGQRVVHLLQLFILMVTEKEILDLEVTDIKGGRVAWTRRYLEVRNIAWGMFVQERLIMHAIFGGLADLLYLFFIFGQIGH